MSTISMNGLAHFHAMQRQQKLILPLSLSFIPTFHADGMRVAYNQRGHTSSVSGETLSHCLNCRWYRDLASLLSCCAMEIRA